MDVVGGKQGTTPENLERVLKARGVLEPASSKEAQELDNALEGTQ